MKNERFYPGGPHFGTSAGIDVEVRLGGRRTTFIMRFGKPIEWMALGVDELRRFHAVIGRHLRLRETEALAGAPPPETEDPS